MEFRRIIRKLTAIEIVQRRGQCFDAFVDPVAVPTCISKGGNEERAFDFRPGRSVSRDALLDQLNAASITLLREDEPQKDICVRRVERQAVFVGQGQCPFGRLADFGPRTANISVDGRVNHGKCDRLRVRELFCGKTRLRHRRQCPVRVAEEPQRMGSHHPADDPLVEASMQHGEVAMPSRVVE
jgi:hypothetical protein